jgi:Tol biopolymer transport system component
MVKRILLIGILLTGALGQAQRARTVNEDVHSGQIVFSSATGGTSERPWKFVLLDLATGSHRDLADYGKLDFGDDGNRPVVPRWSPDDKRLLYSMNSDSEGVFLYDLETGRHERVDQPTERGQGSQGAWSPDGRYIAYQSSRDAVIPEPHQTAFTMDPKAADELMLSTVNLYVVDLRTRTHRQLSTKSGMYPVWSPDGQWIVYYAPAREGRLFRIRPDGTGEEEFPKGPNSRLRPRNLTWSPDGKRLVFSTWIFPIHMDDWKPGEEEEQVYQTDAAGDGIALLTSEKWERAVPVWAPQGDRLALVVNAKEGTGIASIRLVEDGRSREVVAKAFMDDAYNFWSPNGRSIAYTPLNWATLEGRGVSILNLDDGNVRRVATDHMAAYPVWRPSRR